MRFGHHPHYAGEGLTIRARPRGRAACIEGSSFYDLGAILHWCTGNIGFHHIHHLASKIPNYRLEESFRAIPELGHVTRLTIRGSLRSARLHLWDVQAQKLVGFRHLRTVAS